MSNVLEKARKKRVTIRSLTMRIMDRIKEILEVPSVNIVELEELGVQLEEKERILLELDKTIEDAIENMDELEPEILSVQEHREKILSAKTRIHRCITEVNNHRSEVGSALANDVTNSMSTVRLPRLNIARFHGDVSKWQNFWAQFESTFHTKPGLTRVDKFNYLKSLLEGPAASAIVGLALTESNYDVAVSLLKERFGRKDTIVSAHINKLLGMSPVKGTSDIVGLRNLYDLCEVQVRSLESAGVGLDAYGNLLFPLLVKLIPDEIALEFNRRRKPEDLWNVSELLAFLRSEIENRERIMLFSKPVDKENVHYVLQVNKSKYVRRMEPHTRFRPHSPLRLPTAAALGTSVQQEKCVFCKSEQHSSEDCHIRDVSSRRDALKRYGRCFVCLKGQHIARFCKARISCDHCQGRHNSLICNRQPEAGQAESMKKSEAVVSSMSYDDANERVILLQSASALAIGRDGSTKVRCLLDGGSQRTFIHEKISHQLNLPVIGEELLTIHTFGEEKPSKVLRRRVKLTLQNPRDSKLSVDIEALESPTICSATIQVPGRRIQDYFLQNKLQLADSVRVENSDLSITVLVGTDNYWKIVSGGMRRLSDSLVALETILGWTVHGPSSVSVFAAGQSSVSVLEVATARCTNDEELDFTTWKNFWDLDSLGIVENEPNVSDQEKGSKIMEKFRSSIKFDEGRYVVRLPWKDDADKIEDNLDVAKGRFNGLSRKFRANPNLYFRYSEIIEDYLHKGIVEVVDPIKEGRSTGSEEKRIYYLPHRAVIREDKATTKLRVVFDASSHSPNAVSLNDCLESGPNLNPDLLQLLIRFRLFPVAFTADIEQAFLQISLAEEDRDVARFIWVDDLLRANANEQNQKILRMTRVLFGVTSSPFLLAATIKTHILTYVEQYPEACRLLNESLYVDDLIGGAQDVDQAFQRSCEIKSILHDASMNMRKWQTNSSELRKKWSESVEVNFEPAVKNLCEGDEIQKVLGLGWRNDHDALVFDTSSLLKFIAKGQNTKRGILQTVGRIFDPLGFLNPFTIKAKVLFQELWVRKIEWDANLPDDLMERWTEWCLELPLICNITIPRSCVTPLDSEGAVQLHCFSDASCKAYGTVLYLRTDLSDGLFGVRLLASKSRVAPLKAMTVPRLELMGALLSVRLADHVLKIIRETHKVSCFFWTDSMIALHWIKGSPRRWKQFVQNRVTEIQSKTESLSWSHCPGTCNPADLLTRGTSVRGLKDSTLWWNGPEFLQCKRDQWPKEEIEESRLEEAENECRTDAKSVTQTSCVSESDGSALLDIKRYSKLSKLLRVTAWVFRFINNCRNASQRIVQSLAAEELKAAKIYWVKQSNKFIGLNDTLFR